MLKFRREIETSPCEFKKGGGLWISQKMSEEMILVRAEAVKSLKSAVMINIKRKRT